MIMNKIATLIPAYNEGKNIEEAVRRVEKAGFSDYVVVVDDGSKDRTSELAKKSGAIVLKHSRNKGKGEAMKTGFSYIYKRLPQAKYVIIIDADLQYYPEESVRLLKTLIEKKADFVMGKRNWKTVPFRHKLGNWFWLNLSKLFYPNLKLRDTNCGFIAIKTNASKKIINSIHGGYIIENSLLFSALENNLKIESVPVTVRYKKKSGIMRGIQVVTGVSIFIISRGLRKIFKLM